MSIVRVGLSEQQKFADGYEAIFGGRKPAAKKAAPAKKAPAKKAAPRKGAKK